MRTPRLSTGELKDALKVLSGWKVSAAPKPKSQLTSTKPTPVKAAAVKATPSVQSIAKTFSFSPSAAPRLSPFLQGLFFIERIAALAEALNHHPDITYQYNSVSVRLTTHDSGGLTELDVKLAKQIDAVHSG